MEEILLTTQDCPSDYNIKRTLGLVRGNTVRSRNIARNIMANIRTVFGGEIPEFTQALTESREQALARMIEHGRVLGADGIVGIRFITAEVGETCAEILAYGTAVTLSKE